MAEKSISTLSVLEKQALAVIDTVRGELSVPITNIEEFKTASIHDGALREFKKLLRKEKASKDMQDSVGITMIENARRQGAYLAAMDKNKGGGDHRSHHATGGIPTLDELGLNKSESSRKQTMAAVPDELHDKIISEIRGHDTFNDITPTRYWQLAKRKQEQARNIQIRENAPPPPEGQFKTIVIDPPWDIGKIKREAAPNQHELDYPVMSLDEIAALPIQDLAHEQAHLYLWTTQKYLPYAFDLLTAWGFDYLAAMVWHKPGGFQPFGLPQYNCEFVLIGRRQGLPFEDLKDFKLCFEAPRREHSRKPDSFYDLVRRVSPEPRIDYFSREARVGFKSFGAESGKFDNEL